MWGTEALLVASHWPEFVISVVFVGQIYAEMG